VRTPEVDRLLARSAQETWPLKPASGIYEAGRHGVGFPMCAYCPPPNYTREGIEKKIQGIVLLEVIITADGDASAVKVLRGLERSLDQRAVETVRGWRFKPALGPDGKAVAVRSAIEVTYR
jgi:TonB family protein